MELIGPEFGSEGATWRAAAVGKDGHVYCPPSAASRVLRIHKETGQVELIGPDFGSGGGGKWWAAVAVNDEFIYCPPFDASQILRIEPRTGCARLIGPDLGVAAAKWGAAVAGGDGCVYCPPFSDAKVLRIQISTGSADLIGPDFGVGGGKWEAAALGADGNIYCPPLCATRVLCIEPKTGKVALIGPDLGSSGGKWAAAAVGGDGHIYCPPRSASKVLRIQKGTGRVDLIGEELGCGVAKWRAAVVAEDGHLYCPPFYASRVLRIETGSGRTDLIGPDLEAEGKWATDGGKWAAAVLGGDGHMYCPPLYASQVLRISISRLHILSQGSQIFSQVAEALEKKLDPPAVVYEPPPVQAQDPAPAEEIPKETLDVVRVPLWEFLRAEEPETWEPFPPVAQEKVEQACGEQGLPEPGEQPDVRIGGRAYTVDFAAMTQTSVATGRQRRIRRTMAARDDVLNTRARELEEMENRMQEIQNEIARLHKQQGLEVADDPQSQAGIVLV